MKKLNRNKIRVIENKTNNLNEKNKDYFISESLKENIVILKKIFIDDDFLVFREIENHDSTIKYCLAYFNGTVNSNIINDNIIKPLILSTNQTKDNIVEHLIKKVLLIDDIKKADRIKDIIENITYGDVILFIDGINEVLILNAKHFEVRNIIEPENEKILSGPREGFSESIFINLSMIRRKLRTNDLKFKYLKFGERTNTVACVCYLDSIVDKKILTELYKRLKKIKIDGILDTNYITEFIKDNKFSPFRTTGYTEKPDVIVGKLLEGRIAIILDGSPVIITVPYIFVENFQSGEDYYMNYYYTSFTRMVRIFGFFLTVVVPALYISIISFHQEMLPSSLHVNMTISQQNVPLPASIEVIIMLFVFDILRETGIRMPTNIGQALSIVGAIVIGQAAVDASLVSAPMIIVVAFTGITGLLVPKLNSPIIYGRLLLLILSSTLGLFGFFIGLSLIIVHILNLKSLGIYQINIEGNYKYQSIKDTIFRGPWWNMLKRPKAISKNKKRMKKVG